MSSTGGPCSRIDCLAPRPRDFPSSSSSGALPHCLRSQCACSTPYGARPPVWIFTAPTIFCILPAMVLAHLPALRSSASAPAVSYSICVALLYRLSATFCNSWVGQTQAQLENQLFLSQTLLLEVVFCNLNDSSAGEDLAARTFSLPSKSRKITCPD